MHICIVVMCDVSATLILDNTKVGQTEWKLPNNHAWDQVFKIELDKVSLRVCMRMYSLLTVDIGIFHYSMGVVCACMYVHGNCTCRHCNVYLHCIKNTYVCMFSYCPVWISLLSYICMEFNVM